MTVEIVLPSRDNLYFDEIPHLFANAIHPLSPSDKNDFPYHAALINYEGELKQAVTEGLLTPRNPLDLLPIRQPIGEQLKRSLITFDNLAEYANVIGFSIKNAEVDFSEITFQKNEWTREKLKKLYDFHQNEKVIKQNRKFKKATAEHFQISTKRVEQLLKKYIGIKDNRLGNLANQLLVSSESKK